MSTQVQYRRGTASQNNAFTGALAEITVDTTNLTLRVHNGLTAGGSNIATVAYVDNAIGSLSANSITDGTSNVRIEGANGNVTVSVAGTSNVAVFTTTGISIGAITKTGSNGVGNIGQSNNTFNTVFARATSALYADLAELYTADADYAPGTVVIFGGAAEITASTESHSTRIAGVVSTNPAHIMNSSLTAKHTAIVALTGRVPCQVTGVIVKGDCLVSSNIPGVATALNAVQYQPGCVIGKALENYNSTATGTIEVVVGRL
jgi:hypothetical protein